MGRVEGRGWRENQGRDTIVVDVVEAKYIKATGGGGD